MFETEKSLASSWFKSLRNEIVSAFKQIEIDHLSGPFSDEVPGTFEVKERAAREGRNPQTGAKIKISKKSVPTFRAGKQLKDAVN